MVVGARKDLSPQQLKTHADILCEVEAALEELGHPAFRHLTTHNVSQWLSESYRLLSAPGDHGFAERASRLCQLAQAAATNRGCLSTPIPTTLMAYQATENDLDLDRVCLALRSFDDPLPMVDFFRSSQSFELCERLQNEPELARVARLCADSLSYDTNIVRKLEATKALVARFTQIPKKESVEALRRVCKIVEGLRCSYQEGVNLALGLMGESSRTDLYLDERAAFVTDLDASSLKPAVRQQVAVFLGERFSSCSRVDRPDLVQVTVAAASQPLLWEAAQSQRLSSQAYIEVLGLLTQAQDLTPEFLERALTLLPKADDRKTIFERLQQASQDPDRWSLVDSLDDPLQVSQALEQYSRWSEPPSQGHLEWAPEWLVVNGVEIPVHD